MTAGSGSAGQEAGRAAIKRLRHAYAHRLEAALQHKRAGGRVIAFVCDNVPIELIVAAGCFPLRVHSVPGEGLAAAKRLVDPLYPPEVSQRPDFVGSMLGRILEGHYDFVDAIIIPHNRNAVQAIHRSLLDVRSEHGIATPETWYLDKAWSHHADAWDYNLAMVGKLRRRLETHLNRTLKDTDLRAAIDEVNKARAAVRRLSERRIAGDLAGSLAIELMGAFWCLPPGDYAQLVDDALPALSAVDPMRPLYLSGSPVDTPRLYQLAEDQGANIVDEDHCWGSRAGDLPAAEDGDAMRAIAARFHTAPACSIRLPFEAMIKANTERALRSGVDAAVVYAIEGDAAQAWESPEHVAAFRQAGLRVLHLQAQTHDPQMSDGLVPRLQAFLVAGDG